MAFKVKKSKVKVFDNKGKTIDRYTVIIGKQVYTMSDNPNSPYGFNQFSGNIDEVSLRNKGMQRKLNSLPKEVQKAITERK